MKNMTNKQWAEEYCGVEGICQLCGNCGAIALPLMLKANGSGWGGNHYCICPNGRILKRLDEMSGVDSRGLHIAISKETAQKKGGAK